MRAAVILAGLGILGIAAIVTVEPVVALFDGIGLGVILGTYLTIRRLEREAFVAELRARHGRRRGW